MANELYRSELTWQYRQLRVVQTFYWIVNNLTGADPYEMARQINARCFSGFGWLFDLTGIMPEIVFLRKFKTFRCDITGVAAYYDVVPLGTIPGRLLGPIDEVFSAAWLKWHTPNDRSGKHGLRVGPVPFVFIGEGGWVFGFEVRCKTFATTHGGTFTTIEGNEFTGAIRYLSGEAERIEASQLGWPPSRQLTRRKNYH